MHIALFGGKFDPPHNGHLYVAKHILEGNYGVDEVWFLPARTHPWRDITASEQERLAMLSFLVGDRQTISTLDLDRGGETYTIDLVRFLQETTTNTYSWISGADHLSEFSKWKDFSQLEQRIPFFIYPRVGFPLSPLPKQAIVLPSSVTLPKEYSATYIRECIKQNKSIADFVPSGVQLYIQKHTLYV